MDRWAAAALVVLIARAPVALAADLPDWLHARLGQTSAAVARELDGKAIALDPPPACRQP